MHDATEDLDSTPPTAVQELGGYGQTKWVCERRLARHAASGRLRSLTIARVGLIGPCSATCEGNHTDWLHIFCRAVAHVNAAPAMGAGSCVVMLPVDTTAQSLAVLATAPFTGTGGTAAAKVVRIDGYAAGMRPCSVQALLDALHGATQRRAHSQPGAVAPKTWLPLGYEAWRRNVRLCGVRDVQKAYCKVCKVRVASKQR